MSTSSQIREWHGFAWPQATALRIGLLEPEGTDWSVQDRFPAHRYRESSKQEYSTESLAAFGSANANGQSCVPWHELISVYTSSGVCLSLLLAQAFAPGTAKQAWSQESTASKACRRLRETAKKRRLSL